MRRTSPAFTAAVALSALVLAGCSPANKDAIELSGITDARAEDPVKPIGPGGEISMTAFDLGFRDLSGFAVDGEVVFTIENVGGGHNLVIDQAAGDSLIDLPAGETTVGSLLLYGAAGGAEYVYYCNIPGHRSAGMEGELKVYLTEEEARANAPTGDAEADPMTDSSTDTSSEAPAEEPTAEATAEPTETASES